MGKILHWIAHFLELNYGKHITYNKGRAIMMGFQCATCGKVSNVIKYTDAVNNILNKQYEKRERKYKRSNK